MRKSVDQLGFSVVELLFLVVFVIALGAVYTRVSHKSYASPIKTSTISKNGPSNQLSDAYLQTNNPTRNTSVNLPTSANLHTDQQAAVINGSVKLFERYAPNNTNYAIYAASGSTISTLGSPVAAILPGQMQPNPTDGSGCWGVYAPSVLVDPSNPLKVSIVYEADPHTGPGQSGFCSFEPTTTNQYIGMADSSDGGATWSNYRRIIDIPRSSLEGNVGTPSLIYLPNSRQPNGQVGEIGIYYHANLGGNQALVPHMRIYPTTVPSNITYNGTSTDTVITMNMNNQPFTNSWTNGPGRADITFWQNGATGTNDNYFYMILEAFNGTAQCLKSGGTNKNKILIARSTSATGPYSVVDPTWAPTNLLTCAGPDMPTWFVDAQKNYHFISTDDIRDSSGADHFKLQLWDLH